MELEGKIAIITGTNQGIGRTIAVTLAAAGADIAAVDLYKNEQTSELAQEIEGLGRRCLPLQADVSNEAEVNACVKDTVAQFDRIDILVNNAGITKDTLIMRMKADDWTTVLDVNLTSMFYCTKAVTKPMFKQRSGKIVMITSVVGAMGNPGQANYAASKAGVIGLMKSAAKEFAPRGIQVNAVAPGFIETAMTQALADDVRAAYLDQIPLKAFGTAQDVANAVQFLVSENARYITGQVIHVNGGLYV
ncbi:3-oxoacyl-[acyl-carrier-protein] reductase [candidate division KSB3 bacterium]|jgi:3-oxoacyl-[acyl-carrier protein] reductase|uniref:3-oxoacyl-[acyl-carrier-protein] reductase n=1 Tax=candidate division KSB3 bacterium TaxID=2044937 RepID=A0A9D5JW68_9BACT|nr:3-oxoacyl-[acyl-carrier-protein] reductase [candidate division KSB3 bacterium]MBD3325248.1 3-oxoacyl-[acyl-carrier-protein] reductase [candidate division KSB3 bacterium]